MSLESEIRKLTAAINRRDEHAAVAELIRQRDEAREMQRRAENNFKWADGRKDAYYRLLETERRRVRSLRAVIKQLKALESKH